MRLSGGWRPPSTEPVGEIWALPGLVSAIADLEFAASEARIAENLGAAAASDLLRGHLDEARQKLESATRLAPSDPRLWNDLAVALFMQAQHDRPIDFVGSLGSIDRALRLRSDLPEAIFNQAVALDALGLRRQSLAVWARYLVVDSRSEWALEADKRRQAMAAPRGVDLWPAARERIEQATLSQASSEVASISERFRQPVREFAEEVLLPRWAGMV